MCPKVFLSWYAKSGENVVFLGGGKEVGLSKGYVHVYTGNGKGKTTAAIGLAIRALGAGKKVLFCQFMKTPDFSEHRVLQTLEGLKLLTFGKPFFVAPKQDWEKLPPKLVQQVVLFEPNHPPPEYRAKMQSGLERVKEEMGAYDLVVLDEINLAVHFELLSVNEVLEVLANMSPGQDVLLTGRKAPQEFVAVADILTEMVEIRHYYRNGVRAREGIDE